MKAVKKTKPKVAKRPKVATRKKTMPKQIKTNVVEDTEAAVEPLKAAPSVAETEALGEAVRGPAPTTKTAKVPQYRDSETQELCTVEPSKSSDCVFVTYASGQSKAVSKANFDRIYKLVE